MKMRLIFRSGAHTDVDVTEFTVNRNRFDGRFLGLDWTTPGGFATKLSYVRLDEIAAVVTIAEPGDDGDGGGGENTPPGPLSRTESDEQPPPRGGGTTEGISGAPEGSQGDTAGGAA